MHHACDASFNRHSRAILGTIRFDQRNWSLALTAVRFGDRLTREECCAVFSDSLGGAAFDPVGWPPAGSGGAGFRGRCCGLHRVRSLPDRGSPV